jgi:oligogalacturonide lyase
MRFHRIVAAAVFILSAISISAQNTASPTPAAVQPSNNWVDSSTGHRVFKLTSENESYGLYFNENAFTPDGKEMIYSAHDAAITDKWVQNIYVVNLTTLKSRLLISSPVGSLVVARKSPIVYFTRPDDTTLYAIGVDSGVISKVATLPKGASISSLNTDDTVIAGAYDEVEAPKHSSDYDQQIKDGKDVTEAYSAAKAKSMDERLTDHVPMSLYTLNLQTGEVKSILHSTDWISHVQFSPTDPTLLMYCHEGLWNKVDRIWTIRANGSENTLIHKRTVNNEIAGHEFWDPDGVTIWYDLQIPRGQNFYLASYNTETKARKWYSVERDAWSIHYNVAAGDKLFCGDGADYAQVAHSKDGKWIELFTPRESPVPTEVDQTDLVQSGFMVSTHLVNLSKQIYLNEPNVRFSPDKKLVIFTSNMTGPSYIYAVEVAKAKVTPPATGVQ